MCTNFVGPGFLPRAAQEEIQLTYLRMLGDQGCFDLHDHSFLELYIILTQLIF